MIVILLGWLTLDNSLPCLPSWGLQIYSLQVVHAPGRLCYTGRNDIFLVYLQIKLLQLFEHQFNAVQHFIYAGGKYADVV